MNECCVSRIVRPRGEEALQAFVRGQAERKEPFSIGGGRHSMGGQPFLAGSTLLDMRGHRTIEGIGESGMGTIQGGAQWPQVYRDLERMQGGDPFRWTFRQKQTGGDRMTIGGSVAANIHSRGLDFGPFVEDVERIRLIRPAGERVVVSRTESPELFSLVTGGYGLFGVVEAVDLRLVRRHKLRRVVEVRGVQGLMGAFQERIRGRFEYGDFQFAIDEASDEFLDRGVFSCYLPVDDLTPVPGKRKEVPRAAWQELVYLAHFEKAKAFRLYADFYLQSDGQVYWSDEHQMTAYLDGYHARLDRRVGAACPGSEMITELYVPRERLDEFLEGCRVHLRRSGASVIYGTIRLIREDRTSFLRWAREDFACVIFNLHINHSDEGVRRARGQFCGLIDLAQSFGGSFYLTYHRWASREQLLASYPQLPAFFEKKDEVDPHGILQSDWSRAIRAGLGV